MVSLSCRGLKEQFSDLKAKFNSKKCYPYRDTEHTYDKSKYRDFCGDCASFDTAVKIFNKTKCTKERHEKRYKPFRSSTSSWKSSIYETSQIPRDYMLFTAKTQIIRSPIRPPPADNSCFIVRIKEMHEFFKLTEDTVIQDFLHFDSCKKIADKYLIAMVFAYFKRANLSIREYTRLNFFLGLYLASDVEEDEEEIKYEIFPWVLGTNWKNRYPSFLKMRDCLLRKIDYKAIISRRCCDEIMAIQPESMLWKRERPLHHGGATRNYMKDPDDDGYPRGPHSSPWFCNACDALDNKYDSASPTSSWFISSRGSSPNDSETKDFITENSNEDVWPTV